jgi:hypothetical protein
MVNLVLLSMFFMHYVQMAIFYPLLMPPNSNQMPLAVVASAACFAHSMDSKFSSNVVLEIKNFKVLFISQLIHCIVYRLKIFASSRNFLKIGILICSFNLVFGLGMFI